MSLAGCVEAYCRRCGNRYPIHLLWPLHGPGPRQHQRNCIGCEPAPVLFKKQPTPPLEPMKFPRLRIFDYDTVKELRNLRKELPMGFDIPTTEDVAREDAANAEHRPAFYRVLVKPYAVYVKDDEFFRSQGGETEEWGKKWQRVWAHSLNDAREIGRRLRPTE